MKRKINALSFTPKYDELEDRVRISINYDDIHNRIDFMMTRSFVIKLFPTLGEYMLNFYHLNLVVAPKTHINNNVQKIIKDTNSTSRTDGINLELYKQEDELLIEVKFSYNKETKMSIVQFHSQGSEVTSHLDENAMKQVFTIIKSVIPFFSWGISQNI